MANLLEIHNKIMKNFENYQDKCDNGQSTRDSHTRYFNEYQYHSFYKLVSSPKHETTFIR